jgi:hypothetical protein
MPFNKTLPTWNALGTKPPQNKIDTGWNPDEKPPADWFNWIWNTTYEALKEMQENALHSDRLAVALGIATLGADGKIPTSQIPALGFIPASEKNVPNGIAPLDANGLVPSNKLPQPLKGSSAFNSTTGVIINHTIGHTNYYPTITPKTNPDGFLGEVWVEKAANSFKVFCSGSSTVAFDYVVVI